MVFASSELVLPPPSAHRALCLFNVIYQNREKTKSVETHFTWLRLVKKKTVFENCKFRKRARNTQQKYHRKDMPEPTSIPPAAHRPHNSQFELCFLILFSAIINTRSVPPPPENPFRGGGLLVRWGSVAGWVLVNS